MKTTTTEKLRQDITILQEFWRDRFSGCEPVPSQFATWLRLYDPDIIAAGFDAGKRWLGRLAADIPPCPDCGKKHTDKSLVDLTRYVSGAMRNMKGDRELDAEAGR